MANPDRHYVEADMLAVGGTRPPVVAVLNVQRIYLIPILGLPLVLTIVTFNPLWLLLAAPLTMAARSLAGHDPNQPRILRLAWQTGTLFARRTDLGKRPTDPLPTRRMPLHEGNTP